MSSPTATAANVAVDEEVELASTTTASVVIEEMDDAEKVEEVTRPAAKAVQQPPSKSVDNEKKAADETAPAAGSPQQQQQQQQGPGLNCDKSVRCFLETAGCQSHARIPIEVIQAHSQKGLPSQFGKCMVAVARFNVAENELDESILMSRIKSYRYYLAKPSVAGSRNLEDDEEVEEEEDDDNDDLNDSGVAKQQEDELINLDPSQVSRVHYVIAKEDIEPNGIITLMAPTHVDSGAYPSIDLTRVSDLKKMALDDETVKDELSLLQKVTFSIPTFAGINYLYANRRVHASDAIDHALNPVDNLTYLGQFINDGPISSILVERVVRMFVKSVIITKGGGGGGDPTTDANRVITLRTPGPGEIDALAAKYVAFHVHEVNCNLICAHPMAVPVFVAIKPIAKGSPIIYNKALVSFIQDELMRRGVDRGQINKFIVRIQKRINRNDYHAKVITPLAEHIIARYALRGEAAQQQQQAGSSTEAISAATTSSKHQQKKHTTAASSSTKKR